MLNAFRFPSCGNRNGNNSFSFGTTNFSFNSVSVLTDCCRVSKGLGVKFLWRDWVRAILGHSFITSPTTLSLFDPCSVNVGMLGGWGDIQRVQPREVMVLKELWPLYEDYTFTVVLFKDAVRTAT